MSTTCLHPQRGARAIVRALRRPFLTGLCLFTATGIGSAQPLKLTSADLLTANPEHLADRLESARPSPLSATQRARILRTLPEEGEVTNLDSTSRQKLRDLGPLLNPANRFVIKVIDVPQAVVALHARFVVLLSRPALVLLSSDELRAVLAHEIGHEYVWSEYERASRAHDVARLQDLELVCDLIAIVTLRTLGHDASPLLSGIERLIGFNRGRFGAADNESSYPTLTRRKAVARAIEERLGSGVRAGVTDPR